VAWQGGTYGDFDYKPRIKLALMPKLMYLSRVKFNSIEE